MSQSQFTKISKSRLGEPRFERKDNETGEINGKVDKYFLPPEEIKKKYGPPNPRNKIKRGSDDEIREDLLKKDVLREKLKTYSVGQIAQRYSISRHVILSVMENYGFVLDNKERYKEEKVVNKEYETKSRLERGREKISKEEYLQMKEEGLTDKKIIDMVGVPNDIFYKLKNQEWGLKGFGNKKISKKDEPENDESKEITPEEEENIQENIQDFNSSIEEFIEIDDVDWIEPSRKSNNKYTINMNSSQVRISKIAATELGSNYVRIGFSKKGFLLLAPCEDFYKGYKLRIKQKQSTAFGGRQLVNYLSNCGFKINRKYQLYRAGGGWLYAYPKEGESDES